MTQTIYLMRGRKDSQPIWTVTHSLVVAEEALVIGRRVIQLDIPTGGLPVVATELKVPSPGY